MSNKNTISDCLEKSVKYMNTLIMKRLCFIILSCLCIFENSNGMLGDAMSMDHQSKKTPTVSEPIKQMGLYEAIENRRIVRDFQNKVVPPEVLKRIIDAGLKAPTYDHLRNWELVVLQEKKDKENSSIYQKSDSGTA